MQRSGFSVSSILLLTAAVAVFFATIASALGGRYEPNPGAVAACGGVGMVVGACVGAVIGWQQPRRVVGLALGLGTGIAAGAASGVLLAMPTGLLPILVGSLLMVLFSALIRVINPKA